MHLLLSGIINYVHHHSYGMIDGLEAANWINLGG